MKKVGSLDQRGNLDIFGLLLTDVWLSRSHPDSGEDIQRTIWGVAFRIPRSASTDFGVRITGSLNVIARDY